MVMIPGCPFCGLIGKVSTALELLFSYGQAPGAAGLRQLITIEGPSTRVWECPHCGVWWSFGR